MVRADLPIGFLAAQIVHAAGESVREKLPPMTRSVVLQTPDEFSLRSLSEKLKNAQVEHNLIEETDAPYSGEATAIGIVPVSDRTVCKKILSSLPLLRDRVKPGSQQVSDAIADSRTNAPVAQLVERSE